VRAVALLDLEGTLIDYEFWEVLSSYHPEGGKLQRLLRDGLNSHGWYESFLERVKTIIGSSRELIEEVAEKAVDRIRPEASAFVSELKRRGFSTIIVSGGFEEFVAPISSVLGADGYIAQKLLYRSNKVIGVYTVFRDKGEVVDKIKPWFDLVFAMGDGYNDFNMIRKADIRVVVGSKRKELARELNAFHYNTLKEAFNALNSGNLKNTLNKTLP